MADRGRAKLDAVLLMAFGGPERPEDVTPFLTEVLRGARVPPERIQEVARHYARVGGRSPLREATERQATALAERLEEEGTAVPVYVGMRHWHPFARETVARMVADGVKRAVGIVMAAHDSGAASYAKYVRAADAALRDAGRAAPSVVWASPPFDHQGFVGAVAARLEPCLERLGFAARASTPVLFTAHSIPTAAASESPYVAQLMITCKRVAERLGLRSWSLAYQSRSGPPHEPWLEPDVAEALHGLRRRGATRVLVQPIGFVCENVEILYDLDVEARALASTLGLEFERAPTVDDHPLFIGALAELARRAAAGG